MGTSGWGVVRQSVYSICWYCQSEIRTYDDLGEDREAGTETHIRADEAGHNESEGCGGVYRGGLDDDFEEAAVGDQVEPRAGLQHTIGMDVSV